MTRAAFDYGIHGAAHVRRMLPRDDPAFIDVRNGGNVTYMRKRSYRWGWGVALFAVVVWGCL
ncbi:MAG: hypothetical protein ACPGFA_01175 [Pikeienuella sp.]